MPMVVPGHLDDFVPSGDASGQPNGRHRRFRSRRHEADFLERRDGRDDRLGNSRSRVVGAPKLDP